jgi:hypothetical protein
MGEGGCSVPDAARQGRLGQEDALAERRGEARWRVTSRDDDDAFLRANNAGIEQFEYGLDRGELCHK